MKKLLVLLAIAGVVAGFGYAFLYVNDLKLSELKMSDFTVENVQNIRNLQNLSGAGLAAKRFLDMWDRGEFDRLYRNFTSDVQQVLSVDAFVKSKPGFLVGGVLKPQIEDVKEEGNTATVQASVANMDIKTITAEIFEGKAEQANSLERRKILIELKNEGGSWKISQFDPITDALRRLEEERKKKRQDVEATQDAEAYLPKLQIGNLRAQVIHMYGREPFIVGTVKNLGDRDVVKLGIRFTVRDAGGQVLFEDTYHPVVESSISAEEKPLHPGDERKISYQLDKAVLGFEDSQNVSAKVVEVKLGAAPQADAASGSPENEAKDKLRRARQREQKGNTVDLSKESAKGGDAKPAPESGQ